MKAVFDTNVVVSGICFPKSVCAWIFLTSDLELFWSDILISEIFEVISRPKLDRYAPLELRLAAAQAVVSSGRRVSLGKVLSRCRDPRDDHVLQLAVEMAVDYVVTGAQDLLVLAQIGATCVVTPEQFRTLASK